MKNWKALILGIALTTNTAIAVPLVVDKIAAVVNNDIVLESDVYKTINLIKFQSQQTRQNLPDDRMLRSQVVDLLIEDSIILQIARKAGIQISDQQLDQAISNIAKNNHITLAQMRSRLDYNGINYNTYCEQIRKEILISEVLNNEVRPRITILPKEIETLAKQISVQNSELNISHILFPFPENPTQQQVNTKEKLSNKLINELRKGADFDRLAAIYSTELKILKDRNAGWRKIKELPTLFYGELSAAKKGDYIGPIRSDAGFHILKVNDLKTESQNTSITEVHVRHILLKPSSILTFDQTNKKLIQIANNIKNGKISFSEAAKKFSEDTESANQGGDLGWDSLEIYDPSVRDVLLFLKKGEISQPINSSLGLHLIQLLDVRKVNKINEIQNKRAYHLLFNKKFSEESKIWIRNQRARTYVKIYDINDAQ